MAQLIIKGDLIPHFIKACKELNYPITWENVHSIKAGAGDPNNYEVEIPDSLTASEIFSLGTLTNANFYYLHITNMLKSKE